VKSSWLCRFHQPPVTSSLLGPNIFLSTLFSNTLNLCSSLNARDQVSHPYKTTGRTTVNQGGGTHSLQCVNVYIEIKLKWNEQQRILNDSDDEIYIYITLLLLDFWPLSTSTILKIDIVSENGPFSGLKWKSGEYVLSWVRYKELTVSNYRLLTAPGGHFMRTNQSHEHRFEVDVTCAWTKCPRLEPINVLEKKPVIPESDGASPTFLAPVVDLLRPFKSSRTLSCVFGFKLSHFQYDLQNTRY
jgi:hypothetical protein